MTAFQFRAEADVDVAGFLVQQAVPLTKLAMTFNMDFIEWAVEIEADVELEVLRGVLAAVVDGHVMARSLKVVA